jgi:hypothetical protein
LEETWGRLAVTNDKEQMVENSLFVMMLKYYFVHLDNKDNTAWVLILALGTPAKALLFFDLVMLTYCKGHMEIYRNQCKLRLVELVLASSTTKNKENHGPPPFAPISDGNDSGVD